MVGAAQVLIFVLALVVRVIAPGDTQPTPAKAMPEASLETGS